MARSAKRPCKFSGCRKLTDNGWCDQHKRVHDQQRGNACKRGYDHRWRIARALFLQDHPLCVMCSNDGVVVAATVVDHVIAHKGNKKLFWDDENWQALCARHHNIKTAKEDSNFLNKLL